jgi:hypothetical protein
MRHGATSDALKEPNVAGLVSRDARGGAAHPHLGRRVAHALRGSSALLVLGLGRLASTTASGYVVPIDEYGAHWNFFITIAVVRLLSALVVTHRGVWPALGWCLLAAAAHELALSRGGLAAWLDSPVRGADVVSQNREGLVSVVRLLTCVAVPRSSIDMCVMCSATAGVFGHPLRGRVARQVDLHSAQAAQRRHSGAHAACVSVVAAPGPRRDTVPSLGRWCVRRC